MISSFLQMQMDYIFFFYGFGFMLLAAAALALNRLEKDRMPWKWLCLFGIFHGINEWLDMLVFSLKDSPDFALARLVVLAISFLFLVEFGRAGSRAIDGKGPGRWVFIPLLTLAALGGFAGMSGLNAGCRYALGLTGGLWTAFVLWRYRHSAHDGKRPLMVFASSMGIYTLATGAVVPQASFFPATIINHASFFAFTGFPVQLLRGVLACVAAAAALQFYGTRHRASLQPMVSQGSLRYEPWTILAIAAVLAGGWIMTHFFGEFGRQRDEGNYRAELELVQSRIEASVETVNRLVETMAGSPNFQSLHLKSFGGLAAINSTLDRYSRIMPDSICYLLNYEGTTIASSNRDTPSSFVGHSYAVRPYFMKAIKGSPGSYVAFGLTSKVPGYYSSYPVKDGDGHVTAVAVIKLNIGKLLLPIHESYGFLVDPNGIILVSKPPGFELNSLWPIGAELRSELTQSQRYPAVAEPPVLPTRPAAGTLFTFHEQQVQIFQQSTSLEGLSVVLLGPMKSWKIVRLTGILITLLLAILLLVFFVIQQQNSESAARVASSERRYRLIFDHSPLGIMHFDSGGVIRDFNEKFAELIGAPRERILGFNMIEKLKDPKMLEAVQHALDGGLGQYEGDFTSISGNKTTPLRAFYRKMASAKGEFLGAVGLFEDISERNRAEAERNRLEQRLQQAQKAESLGRMAASVAHHFNNTLMAVTGNLELALDDLPEEGDAVDCIREAMKASHRAVEVSRLMLAYLGQTFVKKERLDLAEYSGEVLSLQDVTNGRSVRLNTDMPSPGPIILGQPLHIKQILTNLISNAVEAIGEREGNVAVSVRTVSKEEIQELQFHPLDWQPSLTSYVCLSVSDNGCGMDEPTIGKIFDPFFTTKFLGRGLGLAVVLGLVRAHEGAITVESRQGRGSTFRVFFPLISS